MRYLLPLVFLFFSTLPSVGQSFDFPAATERIYAIPAATVEQLSGGQIAYEDLAALGRPFPADVVASQLAPGHYLSVRVEGAASHFKYFSTHRYEVQVAGTEGIFAARLFGPDGQERVDARMTADGKKVRYSPRHAAYRRRDWHIDLLKVIVDQDTLFYTVTESIRRSRTAHDLNQLGRKQPVRTLLTPYYTARSLVRVAKDGITRGYWHAPRYYPLQGTIYRLTHPQPVSGYVTTSQPKYRPGDTLRISAYLAKPKGKPLVADSVTLKISNRGRPVLQQKIGREEKGRYTLQMAIPEDWPLDNTYQLGFDLPGFLRRSVQPTISFRLEDYELAEYELDVTASEDARLPRSAWLDVRTQDINGLSLPNGTITVDVLLDRFVATRDTATTVLPDTIYTYREPTDNQRERRIILPDSLFPSGHSVRVTIKTQLTGPSGEYQEDSRQLTVDRRYPLLPKLAIVQDSLRAFLAPAAAPPKSARLLTISPRQDTLRQTVQLPIQLPLDHGQESYVLEYGELAASEQLAALRPTSGSPGSWSRDTLRLNFPNPHQQPLRWQLVAGETEIATGREGTPVFTQAGFAAGAPLTLHYQYLAGGAWQYVTTTLTAPHYDLRTEHPKVLDLTLTQPAAVRPGQTVRVTLQATDQKGRPAANVRLTAGTYNARFDDAPVTTPSYRKKYRYRRPRQTYGKADFRLERSATPPHWLLQDLGLDSALAYRLRYPTPAFEYLRNLDTLLPAGLTTAHFSPFIIRKHQPQTIRTVYANNRLVYWWHPSITTPYSIPVDSGFQEIRLRTDGYSYSKRLYFPARRQHILSFDAVRWASAGWRREKIKEPTREEISILYSQVFALTEMTDRQPFYFRTGTDQPLQSGHSHYGTHWLPLGLAQAKDELDFWLPTGDSLRLTFEPRVNYRITPKRDRLYPMDRRALESFQRRKAGNGAGKPGWPRYTSPPVAAANGSTLVSIEKRLPHIFPAAPVARLQLMNLSEDMKKVLVTPINRDRYYILSLQQPNRLSPGIYDILYHFNNDSVFQQRITFQENKLTLLIFHRDSTQYFHDYDPASGYSLSHPPKEAQVTYQEGDPEDNRISGKVVDENGETLPFATVRIRGTRYGTNTDIDGLFTLDIPQDTFTIVAEYTGFTSSRITNIPPSVRGSFLTITMVAGIELDEIVVTGYKVPLIEQDHTTVGRIITSSEVKRLARREVDQLMGVTAGATSSALNEAVTVRGSRTNATDYYVDGVRVSAASVPDSELNQPGDDDTRLMTQHLPAPNLRTTFSDYAAFVPALQTDAAGRAVFDVTFPADITAWNTFVVGQDRHRRVGFAQEQTKAFLPLQAQLYLPRFLVAGDESEAAALAVNRTEAARGVRLTFSGDGLTEQVTDTLLQDAVALRFPLPAANGADSLTYRFSLQALDGLSLSDGEQRSIPVYPRGTELVNGALFLLPEGPTGLPTDFVRPERGPVTLHLPGNRLQQLLAEVDHLVDYPYACTEQTASRLHGLLALKAIRTASGARFTHEGQVRKMIRRLEQLRRPDGGFGWWSTSPTASSWISLHVYQALAAAAQQGYPVNNLTATQRYLLAQLPELPLADQLQVLLACAEEGTPASDADLARLDTLTAPTDYQLLALSRLRQLRGDTIDTQRLLDRSSVHATTGRYWGAQRFGFLRQPLGDRLACGLLAHKILHTAGLDEAADEAANYLLGQTPAGDRAGSRPLLGTNTLESAKLVAALLPALLTEKKALTAPSVTLRTGNDEQVVEAFPFVLTIAAERITEVKLQRTGSGPLPVSLSQRWFAHAPTARDAGFQLTSRVTDVRQRPLAQLGLGETAYLEVEVVSAAEADYVLIEVPIPAGCSFADRAEDKGPYAVHREYRRDRVAIFCDRLPAGTHTYRVALAPRFAGKYTLNPVRAEMQYLPVSNGNGALQQVEIKE